MKENKIPFTAGICTLGCRVNQYESRAIAEILREAGVAVLDFSEVCGAYIINTCAVTGESERKARQMIRRARAKNPDAFIVVTGCAAQLSPEETAAVDGVDFVCGNGAKLSAADAVLRLLRGGVKSAKPEVAVTPLDGAPYETMRLDSGPDADGSRTRAYVKIEDGCSCRCSYCVIPRVRGPVRLRPPEDALAEIEALAAAGFREVVLTGIETSAYGPALVPLIAEAAKIPGVRRLRLGSLDPAFAGKTFADGVAGIPEFMPHLHLSVQSGCDRMLRAMRRACSAKRAEENMAYLRETLPGVRFTADMITGFPGETDEDFAETLDFVRRTRFMHIHIFPFSPRPGTEAAELDGQLPERVRSERAAALAEVQRGIKAEALREYVGRTEEILCETVSDGIARGHTRSFAETAVVGSRPIARGEFVNVKIISSDDEKLIGELTDE